MCSPNAACTRSRSQRCCSCSPAGSSPAAGKPLDEKLAVFDQHADLALTWLLRFAEEHRDEILTVARARHITGHLVHGDGELYEYSDGRLLKEVVEELADGVVYAARRLNKTPE